MGRFINTESRTGVTGGGEGGRGAYYLMGIEFLSGVMKNCKNG